MRTVPTWDQFFLDLCDTTRSRSKDPKTQVGAVAVRENIALLPGYNGFPSGVVETCRRWSRPVKYDFVVHAEENVISLAARKGIALEGSTLYCSLMPCAKCARLIIQAGFAEVVVNATNERAYDRGVEHNFDLTRELFEEGGVTLRLVEKEERNGEDTPQQC